MIHLDDQWIKAAVFCDDNGNYSVVDFLPGDVQPEWGGVDGWTNLMPHKAIAAIDEYGHVEWPNPRGKKREDYENLLAQVRGHIRLWNGACYLWAETVEGTDMVGIPSTGH